MAVNYSDTTFVTSVFKMNQLPEPVYPEIAFAGRSNVGKSSLMNRLINRKNYVKTSSKPGKTQSLNYFLAGNKLFLVDLPGYGYAKVPKKLKASWQQLITEYLEQRKTLLCVVVIVDLRHSAKQQDVELIGWLRGKNIPFLTIYTKKDKLSKNEAFKNSVSLDTSFGISHQERILFSAKTGEGKEKILDHVDSLVP